jgi:hypothetical protein
MLLFLVNHQSGALSLKVARRSPESVISRALIGRMLPHLMTTSRPWVHSYVAPRASKMYKEASRALFLDCCINQHFYNFCIQVSQYTSAHTYQ